MSKFLDSEGLAFLWGKIKENFLAKDDTKTLVTKGIGNYAEVFNFGGFNVDNIKASGNYSHAEGFRTSAGGTSSHAEGHSSKTIGNFCHAEGFNTEANSDYSHAEGLSTSAESYYQHVQGKYNAIDPSGIFQFIIGNGTGQDNRSNAFAVKWDGTISTWIDGEQIDFTPSAMNRLKDFDPASIVIPKQVYEFTNAMIDSIFGSSSSVSVSLANGIMYASGATLRNRVAVLESAQFKNKIIYI